MHWADYRKGSKKAKGHFGFDINHQIPTKVHLTDGNGPERPFVSVMLSKGQTGIMDRGYQSHKVFDLLQKEKKINILFVGSNPKQRELLSKNTRYPLRIIFFRTVWFFLVLLVSIKPKNLFVLLDMKLQVLNIMLPQIALILQLIR